MRLTDHWHELMKHRQDFVEEEAEISQKRIDVWRKNRFILVSADLVLLRQDFSSWQVGLMSEKKIYFCMLEFRCCSCLVVVLSCISSVRLHAISSKTKINNYDQHVPILITRFSFDFGILIRFNIALTIESYSWCVGYLKYEFMWIITYHEFVFA